MDERKGSGLTVVAAWVGLLASILTGGYTAGVLSNRVDNLERQARDMQADARTNAATLAEIKDTTTVIRTKLEILLPTSTKEPSR